MEDLTKSHIPADDSVQIVPYSPEYKEVFERLNTEWISTYFHLEPHDWETLSDPEGTILAPGGAILVACHGGEPLGVCALCPRDDPHYDYELAKLAVSPRAQGLGLGQALAQAAINEAKKLGAHALLIEGNTSLKASIHIYHKLGFRDLPRVESAYERVDIQLGLDLQEKKDL